MISLPFIAGGICAAVGIFLLRQHRFSSARSFGILLVAASFWGICYGLELIATDFVSAFIWARLQYFGIILVGPAWYLSIQDQTLLRKRKTSAGLLWLGIIPLVTLIAVWLNGRSGLIYTSVSWDETRSIARLVYEYGPLFYIHAAYSYTLLALASFALLRYVHTLRFKVDKSGLVIMLSLIIGWAGNVAHLLKLDIAGVIDPSPISIGLGACVLAWALFRHQFLSIVPLARASIVDHIRDGLIVTTKEQIIIDVNNTAARLLSVSVDEILNKALSTSVPMLAPLTKSGQHDVFDIKTPGLQKPKRTIRAHVDAQRDSEARIIGYLYTLEDITLSVEAENRLAAYANELEKTVNEIREYSYVFAHDLRGPVLTMQGFVGELLDLLDTYRSLPEHLPDADLLENTQQSLHHLDNATLRLAQLASAMLDLSSCSSCDLLRDYISAQEALDHAAEQLESSGLHFSISGKPLGTVSADRKALTRIFIEFLRSLAQSQDGSNPVPIVSETIMQPEAIELTLTAPNLELPQEECHTLFDLQHVAGPDGATCVEQGMACARSLARLHQGDVSCTSNPKAGTTLTLVLPTATRKQLPLNRESQS